MKTSRTYVNRKGKLRRMTEWRDANGNRVVTRETLGDGFSREQPAYNQMRARLGLLTVGRRLILLREKGG